MSEKYVQELSEALQTDFKDMIKLQLEVFQESENCCMQFPTFHPKIYRTHIHQLANEIGLKTQTHIIQGGIKFVQVYKSNCNSYFDNIPKVQMTETSRKLIYKYLSENALTLNERLDLTPGFSKVGAIGASKPRVQVYRFSMGSVVPNAMPTIPPLPIITNPTIITQRQSLLVYKYRNEIIETIEKNQFVIICGESGVGKSTQIPQYILENATEKGQHCRIIFAHIHQISAINTSRIVANEREEKLGTIIGYQIRLKSVSSNSTNLLYTTTEFFLRCLMGINSKDVFHGVTHVIIDDCHERDFYTDLLLFEIKEIMSFYPELKVIFLSCPTEHLTIYEDYFSKALKIFHIKSMCTTVQNVENSVKYLDEILMLIQYMTNSIESYLKGDYEQYFDLNQIDDVKTQEYLDAIIENYMGTGNNKYFTEFIYLIQIENIPIDIKHSTFKITMLMAASKNDKIDDLEKLIKLNANVFTADIMNRTAYEWAQISQSFQCLDYLNHYNYKHELKFIQNQNINEKLYYAYINTIKNNPDNVDFQLITSIIKFINKYCEKGTILIFLPCFEDLIKMEYYISTIDQLKFHENITLKIFKLHENMGKRELDEILTTESTNLLRKIILCTNIAESCLNINDAIYVIDSGRYFSKCEGSREFSNKLQWISKEKCERRKLIACRRQRPLKNDGICFRLYSMECMQNEFPLLLKPEIIDINLDKICLFVKLLSPYTSVREHFGKIISTPPLCNIEKSLKLLNDIGAFDEEECVTILGTRLVDIPVDIQLGKVLIYGIILQCLDPVLTIISSLAYKDPLELPTNLQENRKNILLTKQSLADESNSDHLVLLYLFQKWQEDRSNFDQLTMNNFLLNSKLHKICEIRSKIVGIVRAAQLIHSQGIFSMNYINLKGDNWSLVKACFVAGMYPNICKIDKTCGIIKSSPIEKLHRPIKTNFHPSSVLRNLNPQSTKDLCISYQSDWIIYQEIIKTDINHFYGIHSIKSNTLIAPIAIILFAGNIKKSQEEDLMKTFSLPTTTEKSQNQNENLNNQELNTSFIIDNWITFLLNKTDYYLLYNLRQKFSHMFLELLENCDNQEKMRRNRQNYIKKLTILDTISDVLANEDEILQFRKHENVGNRPKALPLAFTSDMNLGIPESDFDFNETQSTAESLSSIFNLKAKLNSNFPTPKISNILSGTMTTNQLGSSDQKICLQSLQQFTNQSENNNQKQLPCISLLNNKGIGSAGAAAAPSSYIKQSNVMGINFDLASSYNGPLPKLKAFSESIKQQQVQQSTMQQKQQVQQSTMQQPQQQKQVHQLTFQQQQQVQQPPIQQQFLVHPANNNYFNVKFYIFKFRTSSEAKSYYNVNKFFMGNKFWDELCLKLIQYFQQNIIFLFDITENKFCGVGELTTTNNKLFEFNLVERMTVDVTMEEFKNFLIDENFLDNFQRDFYCDLCNEVGINLFRCMYNKINAVQ